MNESRRTTQWHRRFLAMHGFMHSFVLVLAAVSSTMAFAQSPPNPHERASVQLREALEKQLESLPNDCDKLPKEAVTSVPAELEWAAIRCSKMGQSIGTKDSHNFLLSGIGVVNELSSRCSLDEPLSQSYIASLSIERGVNPEDFYPVFRQPRIIERLTEFRSVDRLTITRKNGCRDVYAVVLENGGSKRLLVPYSADRGPGVIQIPIFERAALPKETR